MSDELNAKDVLDAIEKQGERFGNSIDKLVDQNISHAKGIDKLIAAIKYGSKDGEVKNEKNTVAVALFGISVTMIIGLAAHVESTITTATEVRSVERVDRREADAKNNEVSGMRHDSLSLLVATNKEETNAQLRRMEDVQDEIIKEVMRKIARLPGNE
jgi:hypothetical protein